jgi:hypothetical protein
MYRFAKQQTPFIIYYYYYYFPLARHVEQDERKDTGVFFFLKDLKLPSKKSILDIDVTLTRILPVCTFIFPLRLHLSCCNTNRIISCLGLIPPQLLYLEAVDALC